MSRIFVLNEPTVPRFSPALAKEIGLLESLVLLQFEFWLDVLGQPDKKGRMWFYMSIRKMQSQIFTWVSKDTLARSIAKLVERGYIDSRNDMNKRRWDKTNWYSINEAGCEELNSIRVLKVRPVSDRDNLSQNETTIPKDYYSNSLKGNTSTHEPTFFRELRKRASKRIDPPTPKFSSSQQSSLLPAKRKSSVPRPRNSEEVEPIHRHMMYRLCYGVEDTRQALTLTAQQTGRVADALSKLSDGGAKLDTLMEFEKWWQNHWQSRASGTGAYQPPRPDQVVEHWWTAMKTIVVKPKPDPLPELDFDKLSASIAANRRK